MCKAIVIANEHNQTNERIGYTGNLRDALREEATAILTKLGVKITDAALDHVRSRIRYHGRKLASLTYGEPLMRPLVDLPKEAFTHLLLAFRNEDVITRATSDTEEWLTKQ